MHRKKIVILLVLLAILLFSDVCVNSQRLDYLLLQQNASPKELYLFNKIDNPIARKALSDYAIKSEDQYWLEVAAEQGSTDALYFLAVNADTQKAHKKWLKLAAQSNDPKSQFEYAMLSSSLDEKEKWLMLAAEQGYRAAIIALGNIYLDKQFPKKAIDWLRKSAEFDGESAYRLALLNWASGERNSAKHYFEKGADFGYSKANELHVLLEKHKPLSVDGATAKPVHWQKNKQCDQKIQMIATSIKAMNNALKLHKSFRNDARLVSLNMCIQVPMWIEQNQIACQQIVSNTQRTACDLHSLQGIQKKHRFTHLILVTDHGKAYVDNGLMYLDATDTYSVFVHELAHFVGFVDEYPMSVQFAQYHCENLTAPNLVVLGDLTYKPLNRIAQWQRTGELTAIKQSNTCKNLKIKAFKPTDRLTFMEYHDAEYIPPIYLALWQQRLISKKGVSPIFTNFLYASQNKDNSADEQYWQQALNDFYRNSSAVTPTEALTHL